MNYMESVSLAFKNIRGSKVRTILTMLGIIIGVTAVIVIGGIGNGMKVYMEDSFAEMGTNTLQVSIIGAKSSRSVSEEDMYQMVEDNPTLLEQVSPAVSVSAPVRIGTEESKKTSVSGVSEDYFEMKDYTVSQGRGLQYVDVAARKNVCVVGTYVANTYYGGNAVGQTIKIGNDRYTIVGVMTQEADKLEEGGTDDCIFLPYSTAARATGTGFISGYIFTVTDKNLAAEAKTVVEDTLYKVYRNSDYYNVLSVTELLDMMNSMVDMNITLLSVIAAISLVVGGIGIMNIMLVSVTERTREIGIRKALGAKERYIMQQFVIEAATTSALGGVVGILFGYVFSFLATLLITKLTGESITVIPTVKDIITAVSVSAAIGIAFGYLPAKKAARLNPIDALRYD